MKIRKGIGIIITLIILIGLIIFISTKEFSDSHLRAEGKRIRVNEGALVVDGCDEASAIYCKKTLNVAGKEAVLEFSFYNFKDNGYPESVKASINGHEFYQEDGLNIEENGSLDYKIFLNFHVLNDLVVFTFTDGTMGRSTTLYAVDIDGNIILKEKEIDEDDMLIKDYTDFITYEDNTITIYATRVVEDVNYHGESICNAPSNDIVEAYYTYTYQDGKFVKKQTQKIDALKFIDNKGITCINKD